MRGLPLAPINPGNSNCAPLNPKWQWLQNFARDINLGPGDQTLGVPPGSYAIGGPLIRYRCNGPSPIGYIPTPPGGSNNFLLTPVGGTYGTGISSKFAAMYQTANTDFVATPQPYLGPFTEQFAMYVMPTGPFAWAAPTSPTYSAFEMIMNADTQDYSLENVVVCGVPTTGTVNFYYSPNGDIGGIGSAASWALSAMNLYASITQNGWYLFSHSYFKAGNKTTDPAISILSVYNASGLLVGSFVIAQGYVFNGTYIGGGGSTHSSQLGQVNYCSPATYWQPGFAQNYQAIGDFGWYLGFPNPALRPQISNAYTAPGATHGSAYSSFTIAASNSPTVYGAQFQQGIDTLSVNTSTGAITGTPATAGTYYFLIWATNAYGTDAAWIQLVVS
jgi:hypothetical protein